MIPDKALDGGLDDARNADAVLSEEGQENVFACQGEASDNADRIGKEVVFAEHPVDEILEIALDQTGYIGIVAVIQDEGGETAQIA